MTMWAKRRSRKSVSKGSGYTLFEILIVLAIASVLLGITVPMISGIFGLSPAEEVVSAFEKIVRTTHASAVEESDARRLLIRGDGLGSLQDEIPSLVLPSGWTLQVKRMAESRFRKPKKVEYWEFNAAGISEPVRFRLQDGKNEMDLAFDPLTGFPIKDEN